MRRRPWVRSCLPSRRIRRRGCRFLRRRCVRRGHGALGTSGCELPRASFPRGTRGSWSPWELRRSRRGSAGRHRHTIADAWPRLAVAPAPAPTPCPPTQPATRIVAAAMYTALLRPLLFLLSPPAAHALAFAALAPVEHLAPLRALVRAVSAPPRDERVVVRRMGLEFASPIGLAGGFDKDARRPRALAALGFGHIELGTATAKAQAANPAPN